jgi:hypothetical protein
MRSSALMMLSTSGPFENRSRGGVRYLRGVGNDKGDVVTKDVMNNALL